MNNDFIDLTEYFYSVLENNDEMIDEFIHDVTDQHGAGTLEWQYHDGMHEITAGVVGVRFLNPLDTVFFKADIKSFEPLDHD